MANNCKEMVLFLTEELKENWTYIRHIEEIRVKHMHVFFIITAAIISLFSLLIEHSDNLTFEHLPDNYKVLIMAASIFVFLYGFFLCIFLALQKRGYENYRIVNAEIRNWFLKKYGKKNQFSFETKLSPKRTIREIMSSTFFYWYLLITLINIFAFMVFGVTFLNIMNSSFSLKCSIILSAFISVFIFMIECYVFIRSNIMIKTTPG